MRSCCDFVPAGGAYQCRRCGVVRSRVVIRNCDAETPSHEPVPTASPRGLGDAVESALKKIGVTPERYAAAKALFGLPPNCGCAERKEWLNKVSDWWRGQSD